MPRNPASIPSPSPSPAKTPPASTPSSRSTSSATAPLFPSSATRSISWSAPPGPSAASPPPKPRSGHTKWISGANSTPPLLSAKPSTTATAPSPASSAWSIPPSATSATPSTSSNASRPSPSTLIPPPPPGPTPNQTHNPLIQSLLARHKSSFRHFPLHPLLPPKRLPLRPLKTPSPSTSPGAFATSHPAILRNTSAAPSASPRTSTPMPRNNLKIYVGRSLPPANLLYGSAPLYGSTPFAQAPDASVPHHIPPPSCDRIRSFQMAKSLEELQDIDRKIRREIVVD